MFAADETPAMRIQFTGAPSAEISNREYGLFFQDEITWSSSTTIAAGVRVEPRGDRGTNRPFTTSGVRLSPAGRQAGPRFPEGWVCFTILSHWTIWQEREPRIAPLRSSAMTALRYATFSHPGRVHGLQLEKSIRAALEPGLGA